MENTELLIQQIKADMERSEIAAAGLTAVLPQPATPELKAANMAGEFTGYAAACRDILSRLEGEK